MTRVILSRIILACIVALLPILARAQNDDTNTPSKLRILVPKREFSEFVIVHFIPETGQYNYSGFAIEVFREAVAKAYTSKVEIEFTPFENENRSSNGSFNAMLQEVVNKNYDGAVGEISILYYRALLVDFTVPYMEAPTTMLVRREQKSTSHLTGGLSLLGITYGIVITTFVLSFIAFLVATIYVTWARCFGKKDNKRSTKTIMISSILSLITFFVLILTLNACYIISQTSPNTSQRGSGMIQNLEDLRRLGSNVGYREGSFHHDLLVWNGIIPESKLIALKNESHMAEMLSKGTSKGGVDAIVANAPQLKLLQDENCDNFTMVSKTILPSAGLGFAINKNTTYARDISRGILRLIDYGDLQKIQDRTIGDLEVCQDDPNNNLDNNSLFLSADHKWILIVGLILVGLLIIISLIYLF